MYLFVNNFLIFTDIMVPEGMHALGGEAKRIANRLVGLSYRVKRLAGIAAYGNHVNKRWCKSRQKKTTAGPKEGQVFLSTKERKEIGEWLFNMVKRGNLP